MIGKAKSCVGGTALANYVMKDAKGYELLRNNLSGEIPTDILHEMKIIQDLNQKAQYKTLSLVLSPEKTEGKKLTNKELQEMTLDFLNELKIDVKNQQYLAFVHTEKEHKHIHIICNRVKDDGTLVTDNFIGKKAKWAAHRIAKERGLISAKERMLENLKNIEQGKDDKRVIKNKILEKHNLVMKTNPKSREEYKRKMYDFGVKVIPTINRQGLVQGYRFLDLESGNNFKASEIHRKLGLNILSEKEILPIRTETIHSTETTSDTDENNDESEIKDQDFSKEDITQNESLETIEEIISNSFDEDFDEQEYNKKKKNEKIMAKLQETLEIFMEELGKVLASINSIKEINPIIDYKINEIKKLALKVEISNLESANQLFLKALGNEYLKIDEITKQHIESLKNIMQKEKNYFSRYYKIGIGFLVVFLLSITLAVKFYYQSKEFEKSYQLVRSKNRVLSDFIDEKNLNKSFERWIDEKRQKLK